jgi:hypothetical protein
MRSVRADAQVLFQLIRADTFLRVYNDGKGHEPLVQGEMRVIEDRAASGREVLLTGSLQALIKVPANVLCGALAVIRLIRSAPQVGQRTTPSGHRICIDVFQALFIGRELLSHC